ncbi:hypothetical protein BDW74DRAFT_185366 [Aspergillus multicolor]|uniref:Zn(II)2Cys6 transcription factor n=1 Tax=Aspergillus multicolor TaxID=41759 RepID=UPI003CCDAB4B
MSELTSTATDNPRRRNRRIHSCLACRQRKLKCDRQQPCSNCHRAGRDCVFMRMDSHHKLAILKEQTALLEKRLEKDHAPGSGRELPGNEDDLLTTSLELALLGIQDAAYHHEEEEDDSDDDLYDLGFRFGKMRVNERVGGFFHPHLADEISANLGDPRGSASPRNLTAAEKDLYFGPGPSFIPPQSGLFFSQSNQNPFIMDWFTRRPMADALLTQYWEAVHPIVRIVHRPSIIRRYQMFWEALEARRKPPASLRALISSMFFVAVVGMSSSRVMHQFGIPQQILQNQLQSETENALKDARLLSTTRLETIQAFILYLIPMCRCEISRAHSALVGMAVRLAESLGLHRDPKESQYSAVETHVRRLTWYQVCFLDLRTAEVQGPRVAIRPEDFSVEIPLNVDDEQLASGMIENPLWTDMTYTRIRFECQEMQRKCLLARLQLEQKKLSLSQALRQIETFRQYMESKYNPIFNQSEQTWTPLQKAAKLLMNLSINRLYTAILHQFYRGVVAQPPARLRQLVITSSIQQLESSIALETMPQLQAWAWYSQTYHQYHVSMLLLLEVYLRPNCPEIDRIWPCLDYVYETTNIAGLADGSVTMHYQKAQILLGALRDRIDIYHRMRRARVRQSFPSSTSLAVVGQSESKGASSEIAPFIDHSAPSYLSNGINNSDLGHITPRPELQQYPALLMEGGPLSIMDVPVNTFADFDWSEWDTLHYNSTEGTS